jgi:hypothetical protein
MPRVVVQRNGSARTKRASIDGMQLSWRADDTAEKNLSEGDHIFNWFVRGEEDDDYGFRFLEPAGIPCHPQDTLDDSGLDFGECPFSL